MGGGGLGSAKIEEKERDLHLFPSSVSLSVSSGSVAGSEGGAADTSQSSGTSPSLSVVSDEVSKEITGLRKGQDCFWSSSNVATGKGGEDGRNDGVVLLSPEEAKVKKATVTTADIRALFNCLLYSHPAGFLGGAAAQDGLEAADRREENLVERRKKRRRIWTDAHLVGQHEENSSSFPAGSVAGGRQTVHQTCRKSKETEVVVKQEEQEEEEKKRKLLTTGEGKSGSSSSCSTTRASDGEEEEEEGKSLSPHSQAFHTSSTSPPQCEEGEVDVHPSSLYTRHSCSPGNPHPSTCTKGKSTEASTSREAVSRKAPGMGVDSTLPKELLSNDLLKPRDRSLYVTDSPSLRQHDFFFSSLDQLQNDPQQGGVFSPPTNVEGSLLHCSRLFFIATPLPTPLPRRRLPLPPRKRYRARFGVRDGRALLQAYRHLTRVAMGHPAVGNEEKEEEKESCSQPSESQTAEPSQELKEEEKKKGTKQGSEEGGSTTVSASEDRDSKQSECVDSSRGEGPGGRGGRGRRGTSTRETRSSSADDRSMEHCCDSRATATSTKEPVSQAVHTPEEETEQQRAVAPQITTSSITSTSGESRPPPGQESQGDEPFTSSSSSSLVTSKRRALSYPGSRTRSSSGSSSRTTGVPDKLTGKSSWANVQDESKRWQAALQVLGRLKGGQSCEAIFLGLGDLSQANRRKLLFSRLFDFRWTPKSSRGAVYEGGLSPTLSAGGGASRQLSREEGEEAEDAGTEAGGQETRRGEEGDRESGRGLKRKGGDVDMLGSSSRKRGRRATTMSMATESTSSSNSRGGGGEVSCSGDCLLEKEDFQSLFLSSWPSLLRGCQAAREDDGGKGERGRGGVENGNDREDREKMPPSETTAASRSLSSTRLPSSSASSLSASPQFPQGASSFSCSPYRPLSLLSLIHRSRLVRRQRLLSYLLKGMESSSPPHVLPTLLQKGRLRVKCDHDSDRRVEFDRHVSWTLSRLPADPSLLRYAWWGKGNSAGLQKGLLISPKKGDLASQWLGGGRSKSSSSSSLAAPSLFNPFATSSSLSASSSLACPPGAAVVRAKRTRENGNSGGAKAQDGERAQELLRDAGEAGKRGEGGDFLFSVHISNKNRDVELSPDQSSSVYTAVAMAAAGALLGDSVGARWGGGLFPSTPPSLRAGGGGASSGVSTLLACNGGRGLGGGRGEGSNDGERKLFSACFILKVSWPEVSREHTYTEK